MDKLPSNLREFSDTSATRHQVIERVREAFEKAPIVDGRHYQVRFSNIKIPYERYSLAEQKKHLLEDRDLVLPVKGLVELIDKKTGKVVEKATKTLAHLPYLTPRGTMIAGGNEYAVVNQYRLKAGVYNRMRENGELESQFNVIPGTGQGFRLAMEPQTGVFEIQLGNSKRTLYPWLKAAGVDDETLEKSWGKDILDANKAVKDPRALNNIYERVVGSRPDKTMSDSEKAQAVYEKFNSSKLDPEVTQATLGKPYANISKAAIVDATRRILNINRGTEEADDRDSLRFRTFHGVEDFLAEKVEKDAGRLRKQLAHRMDKKRSLKAMPAGFFTPQLRSLLQGDTRALPLEEINPVDLLDQQQRAIALGEGGIPSIQSVPNEARNVHGSQFGFVDPIRGPESAKIGVDVRLASNAYKSNDKRIYTKVTNVGSGKTEYVDPDIMTTSTIAFPGELKKSGKKIKVMKNGKMDFVDRGEAKYELPSANGMFALSSNLVPMVNSVSGNRLLMAGKAFAQTLPLVNAEAPLVQSKMPGEDRSFEHKIGRIVASHESRVAGTVKQVTKDKIVIEDKNGKLHEQDIYNNFPFNRQTFIHVKDVAVKTGDKVVPGQLLATTNFTDKEGTLAIGTNLRVAYTPYKGYGSDDGIVISQSASKKLTSEHLYSKDLRVDKNTVQGLNKYISYFPTTFMREQTAGLDEDGVVKPGTILHPGSPVILALRKKTLSSTDLMLGKIHKNLKDAYEDASTVWDQDYDGEVIDVVKNSTGVKVNVKTAAPAKVADKLTGRFGNKGVISLVLPDDQMPQDESGKSVEVILNPLGVISRINPAQAYEAVLGKVARKLGKPFLMPSFEGNNLKKTKAILAEHGIKDTENLKDPMTGKTIPNVLTGESFILKISKTAKSGFGAREVGPYTSEEIPAKGGKAGAKRIGNLELNALLSHGAIENIRDAYLVKGQKNTAFWRAMRLGQPLPSPTTPFIYEKFKNSLRAAGINVKKESNGDRLLPLTDKDTSELSKGVIDSALMFRRRDLEPEKGGLFDPAITGGARGERWGHIQLSEHMPNPAMEEPIRRMLDLTKEQLRRVIGHQELVGGKSGGIALKEALDKIDVKKEIDKADEMIASGKRTGRDSAIKLKGYLETLQKHKIKPSELMITKIPVIPPIFRPVTFRGEEAPVKSAANQLYADVIHVNQQLNDLKKDVPEDTLGTEKIGLYDAVKAVTGLGDPVSPQAKQKELRGFLKDIVGTAPKAGMFQFKMLGKSQDVSGRAVIVPDPTLGIDEVGLPEEMAWSIYKPFMMRDLVQRGIPAVQASQELDDRTMRARDALHRVIADRPVMINRAPTLHKFNILALRPRLRPDKSMALPPLIEAGFNADHDGDAMQVHVPVTEAAKAEAYEKMLPSKNLFALGQMSPMHKPVQEAHYGLYQATEASKKAIRKFDTREDAMTAYRKGELDINDPIEIPDQA